MINFFLGLVGICACQSSKLRRMYVTKERSVVLDFLHVKMYFLLSGTRSRQRRKSERGKVQPCYVNVTDPRFRSDGELRSSKIEAQQDELRIQVLARFSPFFAFVLRKNLKSLNVNHTINKLRDQMFEIQTF